MYNPRVLNQTIRGYFGGREVKGTFGLEIEVEGKNLPKIINFNHWVLHEDGSLRGEAAEFVFDKPKTILEASEALDELNEAFVIFNSKLQFSERTSVHVHYNVQQYTITQVYTILCAWYLFENLLVRYSGSSREGNLFCLRISDIEAVVFDLSQNIKRYMPFANLDDNKYAALNICSLSRFGSLEIRSFRGSADKTEILNWLNLIDHLFVNTIKAFDSPRDFAEALVTHGIEVMERLLLPEWFIKLMHKDNDYPRIITDNTRYIIDIATAINWTKELKAAGPVVHDDPQLNAIDEMMRRRLEDIDDEIPDDLDIEIDELDIEIDEEREE